MSDCASLIDSRSVVFAGGGTGGHLYPGIALAAALGERVPGLRFTFFGTDRAIDRHVLGQTDAEWVSQSLPRLSRRPWHWPQIVRRFHQSSSTVDRFLDAHDVGAVVGTGGLGSVPAVREAFRRRIPTFLINPDAIPGRANRYLARRVDIVFSQWDAATDHFPPRIRSRVHGCPVRAEFRRADRVSGLRRFGLDPTRKTLLITGASQGAQTVNQAAVACWPSLSRLDNWQWLHLTGHQDFAGVRQAYEGTEGRAVVLAYTDFMADAIAASDLVVSRAGGSTLAEITAVGRPSILMPYPFHRDLHQLANARCLEQGSAASIVMDAVNPAVNAKRLGEALTPLMKDDQLREAMAAAAGRMGRADAAARIANDIVDVAFQRGGGGARSETLAVSRKQARYD